MHRLKPVLRRAAAVSVTVSLLIAGPAPAFASEIPQPYSAPQDFASFDRALRCLTEAVYYEARSESDEGQQAVAQVVLNRVRHPSYPNSVCGVVYQGSHRQTGCQFTFTCDGSMSGYIDGAAWARAQRIAGAALSGSVYRPVGLALNYHTTAIRPYWAPSLVRQAVIGSHIFYRRPGSGSVGAFSELPASLEPHTGYGSGEASVRRIRAARSSVDTRQARSEAALIERPRIERPTVERATMQQVTVERARFEPPVSTRTTRMFRPSASRQAPAQARVQAQSRARPAPPPSGPRMTIESGVRVARGS